MRPLTGTWRSIFFNGFSMIIIFFWSVSYFRTRWLNKWTIWLLMVMIRLLGFWRRRFVWLYMCDLICQAQALAIYGFCERDLNNIGKRTEMLFGHLICVNENAVRENELWAPRPSVAMGLLWAPLENLWSLLGPTQDFFLASLLKSS